MTHLRLTRTRHTPKQTLGIVEVFEREGAAAPALRLFTLEPPWLDNTRQKSCIPEGRYRLERRTSPKYGLHLHVRGTEPERTLILFHAGNLVRHTMGCILVGTGSADLDGDGVPDVTQSRVAMQRLMALVSERGQTDATLEIRSAA